MRSLRDLEGKPRSNAVAFFLTALFCFGIVLASRMPAQQPGIPIAWGSANPRFTTFDVPGTGTTPDLGTVPSSINKAGTIAGSYSDGQNHGFLRAPGGAITSFDAPGSTGAIAGYYFDANFTSHGFLRAVTSVITAFDVPGAGTGANQGTFAYTINTAGAAAGIYTDASGAVHGFVRSAPGVITSFDAPGGGYYGTVPQSINGAGAIAG